MDKVNEDVIYILYGILNIYSIAISISMLT